MDLFERKIRSLLEDDGFGGEKVENTEEKREVTDRGEERRQIDEWT